MLLLEPFEYFRYIQSVWAGSYLAEDKEQVIIGIDCEYFYGDDMSSLLYSFENSRLNDKLNAPFGGLFGVFSWQCVHIFEESVSAKNAPYEFSPYAFANARAYLHYDKTSKFYTFYGDKERYYDKLSSVSINASSKSIASLKVLSNLEQEESNFIDMVEKAKQYIAAGDVFQVVLASQLELSTNLDSFEFYLALRKANPSPYMFYYPCKFGVVVGSSPELIFSLSGKKLFAAPIAGTAARGIDASDDEDIKNRLLSDPKELAEHRMLIDLARNDLGRVSKSGSVLVKNAMQVKFYEKVMHIESEVYGQIKDELTMFEALASIFPAGTLSGAPKIRAMQIIDELESSGRGIYGGGIGFLHFNLDAQIAILIRSAIFIGDGDAKVFIGAGAGIVYDSDPAKEYQEIKHKRASLFEVLRQASQK